MEIIHKESTESTNDDIIELAKKGAPNFTTVVADFQTKGRGRRGNSWFAAPGNNLLFSTLIRLENWQPETWSRIPQIAGMQFIEATENYFFPDPLIKMKWPNDLYYYDKKWSGILVESNPGSNPFAVLGMGVNCFGTNADFPDELKFSITTLEQIFDKSDFEPTELLKTFLIRISEKIGDLKTNFVPVSQFCNKRDYLAGKIITVEKGPESLRGVASGIGWEGDLILTDFEGKKHSIFSGSILQVD